MLNINIFKIKYLDKQLYMVYSFAYILHLYFLYARIRNSTDSVI